MQMTDNLCKKGMMLVQGGKRWKGSVSAERSLGDNRISKTFGLKPVPFSDV